MKKVNVSMHDGYRSVVTSREHEWVIDEPIAKGGANTGGMPSEHLLGALGACVAITLKMYAKMKEWPLEGVDVEAFADEDEHNRIMPQLKLNIKLKGDLTEEQKERMAIIATKCPVNKLISGETSIEEEIL